MQGKMGAAGGDLRALCLLARGDGATCGSSMLACCQAAEGEEIREVLGLLNG